MSLFPQNKSDHAVFVFLIFASWFIFLSSCRKDEAIREADKNDVVNGRFFSFSKAAELKSLSLAARDEMPTQQESESLSNGSRTKEQILENWTQGPEHSARVGRIFSDLFGIQKTPFVIEDSRQLVLNDTGVYENLNRTKTCVGPGNQVLPWWGSENVSICPNLDCGPFALKCLPAEKLTLLHQAVRQEIDQRARFTYLKNLNWEEFWAGKWIYGNRYLAFVYAYESRLLEGGSKPVLTLGQTSEINNFLTSFSLNESQKAVLPSFFPERAGVVTSPQYLKRHNNFRSRIRGLAQAMSCQDISAALNPSNIAVFVNTDLSDFDKSHGTQQACASCHYAMDNLGSTLLGWNDNGQREGWKTISQQGHAFGSTGNGPFFLMSTWVRQGPQFSKCMATQIWKSLSGGRDFSKLSSNKQKTLQEASELGLKSLVRASLSLPEITRVDPQ
jgi:hypothetical protein